MKASLRKVAIWAAVALFLLFVSASPAGGGVIPEVDGLKTIIRMWTHVNVVTISGIVRIYCSVPGTMEAESICITSRQEIFVESGGGATNVIGKHEVLARGPNIEIASKLAAEKINRILRMGQILGKNPPTEREFLPPMVPAKSVFAEE